MQRHLQFLCAAFVALTVSALPVLASSPSVSIEKVRLGDHGDKTRLVLDLSGAAQADVFVFDDPKRLLIDVPQGAIDPGVVSQAGNQGLIGALSSETGFDGTLRLTADLPRPVKVLTSFLLEPGSGRGYRLVIDVAATSAATFAAAAADPAEKNASFIDLSQVPVPAARPDVSEPLASAPKPTEAPKAPDTSGETQAEADPIGALAEALTRSGPSADQNTPVPMAKLTPDLVDPGRSLALPQATPQISERPTPANPDRRPIIVIDPGHGGIDPGAIGVTGLQEKDVVLAMARTLRDTLEKSERFEVVLTRDEDVFLKLHERVDIARRAKADLFLSLHADSIDKNFVRGASVYTLSETASDKEAAALARKENQADLIGGVDMSRETPDVSLILIELSQRATMNESARFARLLLPAMGEETKLLKNSHRFAGFRVLTAPDIPSVLVELGYLSNKADEKLLRSPAWRSRLAKTMQDAIDAYFAQPGQEQAQLN